MLTVHLRITDPVTKKPVPCRLRVTDAAGNYYAPLGRLAVFACGVGEAVGGHLRLGKENFAYIDGSCEITLPAGVPLRVQAFRGFEQPPLDQSATLGTGQMALRFELPFWGTTMSRGMANPHRRIDTRCHFLDPHTAALEAAAEDLDEVHTLARVHHFLSAADGNTYSAFPNLMAFSGQKPALEADGRQVFVNTLNRHPTLGTLGLLNCHRPVHPLAFGDPHGPDDWSLCDWADQCHRKGGFVVWCDAFRGGLLGGEALVALILGKVDAIEFDADPKRRPFLPWVYHLWSAGFRVPMVGGSGKESNRVPLGAMRTYIAPSVPDPTPWPTRLGDGNSFITNGPLLKFKAQPEHSKLMYDVHVDSIVPFHKVEVIVNGEVVRDHISHHSDQGFSSGFWNPHHPETNGWVAARVVGKPSHFYPDMPVFAHTSPVFVGEPVRHPESVAALRRCLEQTREWIETRGQFADPKRKAQHLERLAAADAELGETPQ